MRRTRIVALGMSAMLSLGLPVGPAQAPAGPPPARPAAPVWDAAWSAVTAVARDKLEVLTMDGHWHRGCLRFVTDEGITSDTGRPPLGGASMISSCQPW